MKRFNLSLSQKAITGIIVILLPVIITFFFVYNKNRTFLKNRILDTVTVIAEAFEEQVYQFLEMSKRRVQDFASDGLIRGHLHSSIHGKKITVDTLSRHLVRNKLALDKTIKTISVLSLDGRVVASTNSNEIGRDFSHEAFFVKGKDCVSITETEVEHGEIPEMAISAPVLTRSTGSPIGVIVNFIRLSEIDKLLSGEYHMVLGAISARMRKGAWKTMEVYLVNKDKLMITKSRFIKNAVLKQVVDTLPVNLGIASGREMVGFYKDYRGIKVVGASMYIPSTNWVLLVEIDRQEMLAPVRHVLIGGLITASVVIGLVVLVFIGFLKRIVAPIRKLSDTTNIVASGNFDIHIPVQTHDEIGILCNSFNRMSQNIKVRTTDIMKSRESLAEAQRIARIGNWEWDVIKDEVSWSYEAYRIFGLTQENFVSPFKTFLNHVCPDDREFVRKSIDDALNNKKPLDIDHRILLKDSTVRIVHERATVISDNLGRVVRMVGTVQDITERKRAEESLRESEEKLRAILDNTPSVVYVKDIRNKYLFINKQFEKLFHVKGEELQGKTDYDLWPKEKADAFVANDRKVVESRTPFEFEEVAPHDDGLHTYISVKFPLFDNNGCVYAVCGISTDITEHKRTDEKLEKYGILFSEISDLAFVLDTKGNILLVNRIFEKLTGQKPEEFIGKPFAPLFNEENLKKAMNVYTETLNGKSTQTELCFKFTGTLCEYKNIPWRDENGNVIGVMGVARDITEHRQMEKVERQLREQLYHVQKLESVGTLAGGIAHDFNNILMAIIGYGNVLEMEMKEGSQQKDYIQKILKSAERAANLTQGLLAFSRKQPSNPSLVYVNEILQEVEGLLARVVEEDIKLKATLSGKRCVVMADVGQIEQVLMNLAANARDAMPNGGALEISTDVTEIDNEFIKTHGYGVVGRYALITVTDTGMGMDERTKERIFEPFFTTKEVGKGTGLGLAIVYGIIKQHGGYITVETEVGKGTTFRIYLPLVEQEFLDRKTEAVYSAPQGGTETILVAEDEEDVRNLTKIVLERHGYRVIEAVDGVDAIHKFNENRDRVDLLLLDVIMPNKSGKEVYAEIKKTNPDVKILFMSGYNEEAIQRKDIFGMGLTLVSKPISPDDILKKIREVLDK